MSSVRVEFRTIPLQKRFPLRISRGESAGSENLFVTIHDSVHAGLGEAAPGVMTGAATAAECEQQLKAFLGHHDLSRSSPFDAWAAAHAMGVAPCAYAALDVAFWDLLAKRAGLSLYRLFGLSRRSVETSVTVGILPPSLVSERVELILSQTGARFLKLKLGRPEGIEADQEMFLAASKTARQFGAGLRVDANGGWSLEDARKMLPWLAERQVEYVEQPLNHEADGDLPALYAERPLPLYVDESCRYASDVPRLASSVDGVNLKLMKCGGLTEAVRIVATARAHGLKTMIGCMGESSVSISAGASIGALFDAVDLDSHLNLDPDPASGTVWRDGVVLPGEALGHGAELTC
jgi:L-alanine-DL-glutamate epimerase-like enolase superfamily enzyme